MDDQLGKLLQVLEETGYADHTDIVLIGDHGQYFFLVITMNIYHG